MGSESKKNVWWIKLCLWGDKEHTRESMQYTRTGPFSQTDQGSQAAAAVLAAALGSGQFSSGVIVEEPGN